MVVGNCYTFALARYFRDGGWLVMRRSVKAFIAHMQWGAAGLEIGAEPICWIEGFFRIMGPRRGYLVWSRRGCYWRPRISSIQIVEYLPPKWCDWLTEHFPPLKVLPLHVIVFFGWIRSEQGEQESTQNIIDRTWPSGRD